MDEKTDLDNIIDIYYQAWFKIGDIYHAWSKKHHINDTTLFVLYVIKETSPYCTQNKICNKLYLPKQTISLILSGLEADGYILRELNPADRRNKIVTFTKQGEQYANSLLLELKAAEIEAFSDLPKEQVQSVIDAFSILPSLLEKSLIK
ncbi:MarR family transcriptional regulator [Clostridium aminobutyricum]|uniref:MarR family transcriptional regulator n=1 Tax=Clostridium aminobutyricum TaxID=33953 RepID=A0A939D9D1_CLOAM|nr:MarR family transcriptional regulator [Clostridium aminobutyricum]